MSLTPTPNATDPTLAADIASAPAIAARDLSLWYGHTRALSGVSLRIPRNLVTAFIGPSGCGKSSLLRCFNRMNDLMAPVKVSGHCEVEGQDVLDSAVNVIELRKRVGMVFQKSNPFPKSIHDNISYALRLHGMWDRTAIAERVERSLRSAALWEEVKDRLHESALRLSGGQQQRLCIARAIAIQPQILLMDEPASALDPIATTRIEELILELKKDYTIVIVTHNLQQATRISDCTAFFYLGEMIEFGTSARIFTQPECRQTEDYINGRFG